MRIDLPSLSDETRVYMVRPYIRVLAGVLAGFLLLSMPVIVVYAVYTNPSSILFDGAEITFIIINLLMLVMAAIAYVGLVGVRLTISPDGIEYDAFGYTVASPWQGIIGYGRVDIGSRTEEGLVLERALTSAWFVRWKLVLDVAFLILAVLSRRYVSLVPGSGILTVIPLKTFEKDWESGEIGAQIRHYAPHVFQGPGGSVTPAPDQSVSPGALESPATPQLPRRAPGLWTTLQAYPNIVLVPVGLCIAAALLWGIVLYNLSGLVGGAEATWHGHTAAVASLALSSDGRLLVSGGEDGTVRLWDTATGQPGAVLGGDSDSIRIQAVAINSNGSIVASGGWSGPVSEPERHSDIQLWDVATGQLRARLTSQRDTINALAFSPEGTFLASASGHGARRKEYRDYSVRLWNVETATEVFALPALAVPAKALAFSPDGKTLAVGLDNADILLLDVATRRAIGTLEARSRYDSLTALTFLPDGNRLMFVGVGGQMVVWDSAAHRRVSDRYISPKQSLYALAVSRDGTRFAVGGDEHSASVWDLATGERVQILRGHVGDVYSLVFSPDGRTLYSGSGDANRREDHSIRVWRVGS